MKIGDTVILKSLGYLYTTYDEKFKELGFRETKFNPPNLDLLPLRFLVGCEFKVFGITNHHLDPSCELIAIENDKGIQLLVNKMGLSTQTIKPIV